MPTDTRLHDTEIAGACARLYALAMHARITEAFASGKLDDTSNDGALLSVLQQKLMQSSKLLGEMHEGLQKLSRDITNRHANNKYARTAEDSRADLDGRTLSEVRSVLDVTGVANELMAKHGFEAVQPPFQLPAPH